MLSCAWGESGKATANGDGSAPKHGPCPGRGQAWCPITWVVPERAPCAGQERDGELGAGEG